MSYHIGPRVLARQLGAMGPIEFAEVLAHLLSAHVAPAHLDILGHRLSARPPGHAALVQAMQEHLSLDLGPIGLATRQLCSQHVLTNIWNQYHELGQVLAPSAMQLGPDGVRLAFHRSDEVGAVVQRTAQALGEAFERAMSRNVQRRFSAQRQGRPYRPEAGLRLVSELARALGMPALVIEACLFFEAEPRASVSDWVRQAGFPARRLERWFGEHSITQQCLRRACCLAGASQSLLQGRESLSDIAEGFGYTDAAHFTRVFKQSSGGLAPGIFSGILLGHDMNLEPNPRC